MNVGVIREALEAMPRECQFHGWDLERAGMFCGYPRCESCRVPWLARRALAELDKPK